MVSLSQRAMKRLVSQQFYDRLVHKVEKSGLQFSSRGQDALEYSSARFLLKNFDKFYKIMQKVKVLVVNKSNNPLPAYADNGFNSGCDARADLWGLQEEFMFNAVEIRKPDNTIECVKINPGGRALIPTGLYVAIPEGYEIQVRPRSGLALKFGISCTNSPGTIDACYRGEIGIIIENRGTEPFEVRQGDKIAQLVLKEVPIIEWVEVEELDQTKRGDGAYNSTGLK